MKKTIGVVGSWHLATVITGCLVEKGYAVKVADPSAENIRLLQDGSLPIFEPQLGDLIKTGLQEGRLSFSNDFESLSGVDIVYCAKDATKTEEGVDLTDIIDVLERCSHLKKESFTLIISSQLPVGTCEQLKKRLNTKREHPIHFASVPEFLRLGDAVNLFRNQDYTIIGCDDAETFNVCSEIFSNFSKNIFRMKLSEAELSKHMANCFVATTVSFVAEFIKVADAMGIDLLPVSKALRFDKRIGPKSYLLPGLGFTGGNLERDIKVLQNLLKQSGQNSDFLDTVVRVNDNHNQIVLRKLEKIFPNLQGKKIAFLGITYKSFTNTLAGSLTIAAGEALFKKGCTVSAYDPLVSREESFVHQGITISPNIEACLKEADAVVVMIDKPEFRGLSPQGIAEQARQKILLDAANMFASEDFLNAGFKYTSIGRGVAW